MLLVAGTIAVIAATVFAAIAMGGDDTPASADATTATVTTSAPAGTTTPAQTPDSNELGPAPVMTAHVTKILPEHGGKVKQAATRESNGQSGVCAVVSYKDLPENNQWFRMAVDDQEVTQKLSLIVTSKEDPEGATMCYAPKDGLSVGRHSAAIIVQNPRVTSGPPQETVAWKFDVVE